MRLPFKVLLELPSSEAGVATLAMTLIWQREATPQKVNEIRNFVELFGKAASVGAFAGPRFPPSSSRFDILELSTSPDSLNCRALTAAVEHTAFRALINGLLKIDLESRVIESSEIFARGDVDQDISRYNRNESPGLPEVSLHLNFPWEIEYVSHPNKDRVLEIEFHKNLDQEQARSVTELITVWDALTQADAFAPAFEAVGQPDRFERGEIYFTHPSILEHTINRVCDVEHGFPALVNMAGWIDEKVAPIASLTIR